MRTATILLSAVAFVIAAGGVCKAQSFPQTGKVNAEKVNLRAQPDTAKGAILGRMTYNDTVIVHGVTDDGKWYEISYPSTIPQYIYAKYVRQLDSKRGEVIGNRVRVRTAPSIKSTEVARLDRRAKLTLMGKRGKDWYKIRPLPNSRCYIYAEFVDLTGPYSPQKAVQPVQKKTVAPRSEKAAQKMKAAPAPKTAKNDIDREIELRRKRREAMLKSAENAASDAETFIKQAQLKKDDSQASTGKPEGLQVVAASKSLDDDKTPIATGVIEREKSRKYLPYTHRLRRSGLTLYYLKSDKVNLDQFANKRCKIYGTLGAELKKITRRQTIEVTGLVEEK